MSFIASMVSAAVGGGLLGGALGIAATGAAGAGLGAGIGAATGGDAGEGALMGGIGGMLAGGAGLAFAPAAATEGAVGAGAATGTAGAGTGTGVATLPEAVSLGATNANAAAITPSLPSGIGAIGTSAAPGMGGTLPAVEAAITPSGTLGTGGAGFSGIGGMTAGPTQAGSLLNAAGASTPSVATPFLDTLAGKAVTGAGIGALTGGVTNPNDPLKGAAIGAGTGALGGYGAGALAQGAGSSVLPAAVGEFAAAHPMITSGLISVPTSMALDSMTAPEATPLPTQEQRKSQFTYNGPKYNYSPANYTPNIPEWNVYKPTYYAAGGITDLDTYASQAQNIATGGITQIPNPAEVADPEGYGQESVQMMAGGGISKIADNLVSMSPIASAFGWDSASEIPLIGGLFNKPDALPETATLTPEEKQKLMAMMAAQQGQQAGITAQQPQQMAQGGIADLGGYATGGRPNLLNGAGDGISDSIPATIAGKQPARLAAGEYVISSRIVSELGNGSTDAGAQRLDEMVKRIQAGRSKTMGKGKEYAKDTKPYKHLPA